MTISTGPSESNSGKMPFRKTGGWIEPPEDLQPQLEGHVTADVIVVGAGFAGLSTALELTARGAKVIVLEQEFGGFGASGRNAGYLVGSMGIEFDLFAKRVGYAKAKDCVSFYDQAVPYVEKRIRDLGIACDHHASGILRAIIHPSQEKRLRHDMGLGRTLGSETRFVDSAELRSRGIPPAFLAASEQAGGTLNPGKYVSGLRRAAIAAGVMLYEKTRVLSYREGRTVTLETERGRATAPVAVLATNAYTLQLNLLQNKIAALRVSAIETEPLSPDQLAALGWQGREGIITPHLVMESHRLTAHNTLVSTVRKLNYVYGSKTPNIPDDGAYRSIREGQLARFPSLEGVGVRHCWSGYVSAAYDALPVVGTVGDHENLHYVAGCSGHGLCTHSFMGWNLAEKINGAEPKALAALRHKTPRTLPEPLQWCGLKATFALTRQYDAWTNRKAARARNQAMG